MTWTDYLERPDLAGIYVIRISGLPYLFSHTSLPDSWDAGLGFHSHDSELYQWSRTLMLGDGMSSLGQRLQPKAGLGESGGLDFRFEAGGTQAGDPTGDTWLHLMCNAVNRTDGYKWTNLAQDISAAASGASTPIALRANKWGTTETTLYMGLETVVAGGGSSTAVTLVGVSKRGAFGSQPQAHRATAEGESERQSSGKIIADYPLAMEGRFIEMWFCPGKWQSGVFTPYGANLASSDNQIVYAGYVDQISLGGDLLTVEVRTSSLDRTFKGPVCRRFPTAKVGLPLDTNSPQIYIGPHNWYLHWRMQNPKRQVFFHIHDNSAIADGDTVTIGETPTTYVARTTPTLVNEFRIQPSAAQTATELHAVMTVSHQQENGKVTIAPAGPGLMVENKDLDDPAGYVLQSSGSGFGWDVSDLGKVSDVSYAGTRLRDSNGDLITERLWGVHQVISMLRSTIRYGIRQNSEANFDVHVSSIPNDAENPVGGPGGPPTVADHRIRIVITPFEGFTANSFEFYLTHAGLGSILQDLGFEDDIITIEPINDETVTLASFYMNPSRNVARFRWPRSGLTAPTRLYIREIDSWSRTRFLEDGWEDDDGSSVGKYVVLEKAEVLRITGADFGTGSNTGELGYLTIAERGVFGTETEEIYLEHGDDKKADLEVYRAPAFPGVNVNRMFLYLLLGGSGTAQTNHGTWDAVSWPDCGLNLPPRFVDIDSFLALADQLDTKRDSWLITKDMTIRKVFDEELKITQQQISSALGQLYMIHNSPPSESSTGTAHVLDASRLRTDWNKGVGFDKSESRLVNSLKTKSYYNPATKKFGLELNATQLDSIETWGKRDDVQIEIYGKRAGRTASSAAATSMFGAYSRPYGVIDLDVAKAIAWSWKIGDTVFLTHPALPTALSAGRGVVNMPCRIIAKEDYLFGQEGSFGTVTLYSRAYDGLRRSGWAPCMQCLYSGGWKFIAHQFSNSDEPEDSSYFAVGMGVTVYRIGYPNSSPVETVIDSMSATSVVFADSIGHTDPIIVVFSPHDSADTTADQKKYVFFTDKDEELTNSDASTVGAFYYM